ncbi:IS3 family transposase [Arthrobacter sp. MA-N2]|uniref:IS3 family transposase n=1 Tax=Arthrobacter sp. MA-N2 TaxID=1101188 RepID=UPI0009DE34C2
MTGIIFSTIGQRSRRYQRVQFTNTDALETALDEDIRWYNTERISRKLESLSPVQYRAQAL